MRAVEIFRLAFADEHAPRFRGNARPAAFVDVWRFIQRTEPENFLAARENGMLIGYAIFVRSLKGLQRRALLSGEALRWALKAITGQYDLRLGSMARILKNKALFIRNGQRYRTAGDAQLLNVAVHPNMRGRGVARALVTEGLGNLARQRIPEVRLEVRPRNRAAVRVYESTGWRTVGRTRDAEGEWLVMVANPAARR